MTTGKLKEMKLNIPELRASIVLLDPSCEDTYQSILSLFRSDQEQKNLHGQLTFSSIEDVPSSSIRLKVIFSRIKENTGMNYDAIFYMGRSSILAEKHSTLALKNTGNKVFALDVSATFMVFSPGSAEPIKVLDIPLTKKSFRNMILRAMLPVTVRENNSQEPHLAAEWRRINVGWMASCIDAPPDTDSHIVHYIESVGCQTYTFVSYPVGGVRRGFWNESDTETFIVDGEKVPRIDLPDLQLQNHLWETYVNGVVSDWIDCDSDDPEWSNLSELELLKELNYAAYMGLRSVVVPLKRADSNKLATVLNKWLWTKNVNMAVWICLPSTASDLLRKNGDDRDIWEIWADFRTQCCNFTSSRLIVGIRLRPDLDDEFLEEKLLDRWQAEPLAAFWIDAEVFVTDSFSNKAILPQAHSRALRHLWSSDNSRVIVKGFQNSLVSPSLRYEYSQAIRDTVRDVSKKNKGITDEGFLADGNIDYMDVLQAPLQPLSDNLDSNVYNTFEQDPVKYKRYREAIESCLHDLGESAKRPESLVLYVLGAGRGPLVTAAFEAEKNYNSKFRFGFNQLMLKMYAVEKNPNAIVTLDSMNETHWKYRCTVIQCDMREVPKVASDLKFPQPDIIVSELLGSFGDNELSPECLDGVTSFLKETTISIPSKYSSFAAPIMSTHMYQTVRGRSGPSYWNSGIPSYGRTSTRQLEDKSWVQEYKVRQHIANMDQVYVVFLRQFCSLSSAEEVFTFEHPNFSKSSNDRHGSVTFVMDRTADIMGFAGYFHMTLYKDITLSIEPSTYSKGMISWFPALIPLKQLHRVYSGDKVTFVIDRKSDASGVWYEWLIEHQKLDGTSTRTVLQNENGDNYYMGLNCES